MSIAEATSTAMRLLLAGDPALWQVVGTSLAVSLAAIAAATPVAVGAAYLLAGNNFAGKTILLTILQALLAMPTVVVGLLLFLLLSTSGPLGGLELLFTPSAVAIGQFLIALPIMTAFAHGVLRPELSMLRETAITLGANRWQAMLTVLAERKAGLVASLLAGFGRVISEVGCALLIGGNIAGSTRTLPTAIALETARGEFATGIAMGIVLLALALCASAALLLLSRGKGDGANG